MLDKLTLKEITRLHVGEGFGDLALSKGDNEYTSGGIAIEECDLAVLS